MRVRAQIARAALFRPSQLKSLFNPAYVSNLSAWQRVFGESVNAWGIHGDAFAVHPLVHRAISVIHDSAMGVPIVLSRKSGAEMVPVETGVEWQALNRPSSYLSRAQLMGATAGLLKCPMGEAFWLIVRVGEARAIVLLQPENVNPERASDGSIRYRVHLNEGDTRVIPEDQIIHFKTFNPSNLWRGLGSLQALNTTITDDLDIGRHNRQMVRNGGLYRPILQTDGQLPEIGSPEDEALEKQLEKLLGTPDSRGRVVVLPGGLKVSAEALRAGTDQDYGEAQIRNLHKISGATGVPPAYLGRYERDQADSQAQERDLWNACVGPILRYMGDKIETDMWKLTGLARAADTGINVGWDWDSVPALVRQKQALWAGDTQDVQNGIVTINEVRRRRGLPDVPWGDVWWASGLPTPINSEEAPQLQQPTVDPNADPNAQDNAPPKKTAEIIPLRRSLALDAADMKLAGFLVLQATFEGKGTRALQSVISDIEDEVLANLRSAFKGVIAVHEVRRPTQVDVVLFDVNSAIDKTKRALRPTLREAQMAGGRRGLRLANVNRVFSVDARPAIAYLNQQEKRYGTDVVETTWERLKHSLEIGLREGESEKDLTRRVERVMEVRRSDAQRTAATEVAAAANGGVALGFIQSEVVKQKRWLTAGDEHVREAHQKANGQTVALTSSFLVGGENLAFPCAPEGSPGNVYNCRCTIEPVLQGN